MPDSAVGRQVAIVPADRDGFCPALQPFEACKTPDKVWHFCTPDNARFAVASFSSVVEHRRKGITVCGKVPQYAGMRGGKQVKIITNCWTVTDGRWQRVSDVE